MEEQSENKEAEAKIKDKEIVDREKENKKTEIKKENSVDKILNAQSFGECFENLHDCKLDDILLYEFERRLIFTKVDRKHYEQVVEFENIAYNPNWNEKDQRLYCRYTLRDFMTKKVLPKRKLLEHTISTRSLYRSAGVFLCSSAAFGSLILVPPTYFPFAVLGCAGLVGGSYFYLRKSKKKRKDEFAKNNLFFSENAKLLKEIKTFDVSDFFEKNKELLKTKITKYYNDLEAAYFKKQ